MPADADARLHPQAQRAQTFARDGLLSALGVLVELPALRTRGAKLPQAPALKLRTTIGTEKGHGMCSERFRKKYPMQPEEANAAGSWEPVPAPAQRPAVLPITVPVLDGESRGAGRTLEPAKTDKVDDLTST